ncbi:Type IV secretion system protein, TraD, DNA-binding domain (plasmid) [Sphingopyxis fribergensis]|uniref:Type IV secretion system protein, TraD, DNA-binding domain n=3 Tax=Sphingopyxis TaxID=165697 RepID=A0A0A7PU69_9SPHN|nr:Type IV secretion system protein, TraD, DNA-binding domain [Sphingopyxis fribergensis]
MTDRPSRPRHPRSWSSHGEANRNSGNFTRGSQLIGHQFSMWWRGARVPLFVWFGLLAAFTWVKLTLILDDYEFQMLGTKALAATWDFIGLDEMKRANVTLRDGSIYPTYMGYVPYIPDVQVAWAKLMNALFGSLFFASAGAGAFALWFIPWARDRGESILADHHERGVEIVEYDVLKMMLDRHNLDRVRTRAKEAFPDLTLAQVEALPLAERKAAGVIFPYKIATLPFPYGFEQSHVMLTGTTGTGKTTLIRQLVAQAIERGDRCVLFDLTGHYMEAFYDPDRDHVLNLNDARCESWSLFNDCESRSEFVNAATALIPADHGSDGGFWEKAARTLFVEMCDNLKKKGKGTNRHLSDELLKASLKKIYESLKGTVADPLISPDAAKMAQSIRAVLNAHAESIRFLPDNGEPFSIKNWVERDDGKASILFITARYADLDMSKSLLTLWMNIAINTIMTLPHSRQLRTWYIFDELAALHKLPALERGLQTARSFGGAFVLGLHNFAGLRAPYGEDGARNIISLTNTKIMLRTTDRDTAEECSRLIGFRKVRTMDESYSYGAHQTRDASTISPTTKEEALVIADDITSLPNLNAYVRFPEKFPATLVSFPYVGFSPVAEGFIKAPAPPELEPIVEDDSEGDGEEGGGQDIANDRPEPGTTLAAEWSGRPEAADLQEGRGIRARDVLDVGRGSSDSRSDLIGEPVNLHPAGSLAKRSIDDVAPNGAIPRNAATGSSGRQDALSYKERLRGAKDPTEERSGELARRESRMDFGESEHRRAGGAELGADGMARGSDDLGMDMD